MSPAPANTYSIAEIANTALWLNRQGRTAEAAYLARVVARLDPDLHTTATLGPLGQNLVDEWRQTASFNVISAQLEALLRQQDEVNQLLSQAVDAKKLSLPAYFSPRTRRPWRSILRQCLATALKSIQRLLRHPRRFSR